MAQIHHSRPPQVERRLDSVKKKLKKFVPKTQKSKRRKLIKKIIKKTFWTGLTLFLLFLIYLIGAFAWYSKDLPDPNKILDRDLAQSTKIYDRTGETMLYDVHGDQKRTLIKIDDIPNYVKWATISAEDKYFYEHNGFNIFAMFKGVVIDPLLGRGVRGGSTLTQQFVKNSILTNERRVSRKIKEFILSYKIEKSFEKDEILQMYLNEIPYGSVAYGVQSASQTFFGKDVEQITLAEAAILAALPKAPTFYSPYGANTDRLYVRQQYVLDLMAENGYITQEEADTAKKQEVEFVLRRESILAPHFVMYIKQFLSEELGEDFLETGGLRVTTTLDYDKQKIAEEAVVSGVDARGEQYGFHNASLISLDPQTGQILAMVGSKDYFDIENDGNVNVTLSLRQPGSSMKPLVYAAGFKNGYTPSTVLYDVETNFKTDTKDYFPRNYDLQQHGPVTIRKALQGSLNIPAVKMIYLVGVENVINLLEQMGYSSFEDRSRFGLALVLGGGEVRLIEHASAFGTLANQGVYNPPVGILKVEDSDGNILLEYKQKDRKVLDSKIANTVSNVLSDNDARAYVFGSSNNLVIGDRPVAAKTGTTNDYRDAWTMGYTPNLVTGVWVGNNDNTEMARGAAGGVVAGPIWNEYMRKAVAGMEKQYFPDVEIEKTGKPVLDGEISAEKKIKIDKFTGKLATEYTPEDAIEEKVFQEAHSILHYIYKDDPRGGVPEDPAQADRSYLVWEGAVQEWLKNKIAGENGEDGDLVFQSPPTEFDDIHTQENKPTIFLNGLTNNQEITSDRLRASVDVSAPRGVDRVEYYIDNTLIQTRKNPPYNLNYLISSYFVKGYHSLRAVAFDDVDNSNEASVNINIKVDLARPNVIWQSSGVQTYSQSDFPITLTASLTDLAASWKVGFYLRNSSSGQENLIVTHVRPSRTSIQLTINSIFENGNYEVVPIIEDPNGDQHRGDSLMLNVN